MKKQMFLLFSLAFVVVTTANGHALTTKREVSSNSDSRLRKTVTINVGDGITVTISRAVQSPSDRLSDLGYVYRSGSYYKFHEDRANWLTAKNICDREGAHLVVIDDEAEAQVVADLFPQNYVNDKLNVIWRGNSVFIGLSDTEEEGEFVTVLGGRVPQNGYLRWMPNEPNNSRRYSSDGENCVEMNELKQMNDLHCTADLRFVCEVNS